VKPNLNNTTPHSRVSSPFERDNLFVQDGDGCDNIHMHGIYSAHHPQDLTHDKDCLRSEFCPHPMDGIPPC